NPHGSLSFDDVRIIKRMDEGEPVFGAVGSGRLLAVVERVAHEDNFHTVAAEHFRLADFLFWGGTRHEYNAIDTQLPAGKGHALGVVSSTGAHHSFGALGFREFADSIVRAPKFI